MPARTVLYGVVAWVFLAVSMVFALLVVNALFPVRREPFTVASFAFGWIPGELPVHVAVVEVAATVVFGIDGALRSWPGWLGLAVALASWGGMVRLAVLGHRAGALVDAALDGAQGGPIRVEGLDDARWVLMDYGDFLVHVFLDETREYYDLEHLWSAAPRVPWTTDRAPEAG